MLYNSNDTCDITTLSRVSEVVSALRETSLAIRGSTRNPLGEVSEIYMNVFGRDNSNL